MLQLLKLALPMMLIGFCQIGIGNVYSIFAGRYSTVDLAGVALGTMIWTPTLLLINGIISALTPLASNFNSIGDTAAEEHAYHIAMKLSLLLGLGFCATYLCLPYILNYFSNEQYFVVAGKYLQAVAPSLLFSAISQVIKSRLEAKQNVKLIMIATVSAFFVNIPLNYYLVNGISINGTIALSALGGAGCGIATSLTFLISLILLAYLARYYHPLKYSAKSVSAILNKDNNLSHRSFIKLGLPIGLTAYSEIGMFFIITILMVPFGDAVIAGHQIVMSLLGMVFVIPMSIGMAATIILSHTLSGDTSQSIELARQKVRQLLRLSFGVVTISSTLLLIFHHNVLSLYSQDSQVITIATPLLLLAISTQFFDTAQTVMTSVLKAYMDTFVPFMIMSLVSWLIALPLGIGLTATLASQGFEAPYWGYYFSLFISLLLAALGLWWRYLKISKQRLSFKSST